MLWYKNNFSVSELTTQNCSTNEVFNVLCLQSKQTSPLEQKKVSNLNQHFYNAVSRMYVITLKLCFPVNFLKLFPA